MKLESCYRYKKSFCPLNQTIHHNAPRPKRAQPTTAWVQYGILSYGSASAGREIKGTMSKKTFVVPKKSTATRV